MNELSKKFIQDAKEKKATVINLHNLDLTEIPLELFELIDLTKIYISNNRISEIPIEICKLKNLRYLNISNNRISDIPEWFTELRLLSALFLSSNKLTQFPEILLALKSLEILSLSDNKIKKLPSEIKPNNKLSQLFLAQNSIETISKKFIRNLTLDTIDLSQNPLIAPPIEIVVDGIPAIRNYFDSIDEFKDTYKIFEAKLLIVGEGFSGKTCLMHRLTDPKLTKIDDIKTTEGIEIKHWFIKTKQINDFRINVWDFGGQEIYHATHQFFLTKRSLYLFVWTARKDDNIISFDYWLNVIKLLSDNAPVIVVLNKIDERINTIDEYAIQSKFPNVKIFHKASALTGEGIDDLKNYIKIEIEKLSHIGGAVPKVWVEIRAFLENINQNYITKQNYIDICKNFNLTEEQALFLSKYYNDLGVFLHFQDNEILDQIIFLKPEWATNAVYKVVDTKEIQLKYGEFDFKDLKSIWKEYNEKDYVKLIELMKKFELCFSLDKSTYLAPGLLSEKKPLKATSWKMSDNFLFDYQYDFMPSGLITRFIVRNHDMIVKNSFWKNGVIINRQEVFYTYSNNHRKKSVEETIAIIESKPLERKISIRIYGKNISTLLAIIRREFDYIHKTLNNPAVKEMIPCNCKYCSHAKEKNFYAYADLRIYLENREYTIFCTYGQIRVEISNLLQIVNPSEFKAGTMINNISIQGTAYIADNINQKS